MDEITYERRWLYHGLHNAKIFEADQIKDAIKEGWKFWPWEVRPKNEPIKEVTKIVQEVQEVQKVQFEPDQTVQKEVCPNKEAKETDAAPCKHKENKEAAKPWHKKPQQK